VLRDQLITQLKPVRPKKPPTGRIGFSLQKTVSFLPHAEQVVCGPESLAVRSGDDAHPQDGGRKRGMAGFS